jgi:hypothetical protein
VKLICKQCGREFAARKGRLQFCRKRCHSASMRRADLDLLSDMVDRGELSKNMAVDLGVSRGRVHYLLRTHGFLNLWHQRRYARFGKGCRGMSGVCAATAAATPSSSTA